jgi:hypothetical protein
MSFVPEHELALVVGAPQSMGSQSLGGVPSVFARERLCRVTRLWRPRMAWMVLQAGTRTSLGNLRSSRSRSWRAPRVGFSRRMVTIIASTRGGELIGVAVGGSRFFVHSEAVDRCSTLAIEDAERQSHPTLIEHVKGGFFAAFASRVCKRRNVRKHSGTSGSGTYRSRYRSVKPNSAKRSFDRNSNPPLPLPTKSISTFRQ